MTAYSHRIRALGKKDSLAEDPASLSFLIPQVREKDLTHKALSADRPEGVPSPCEGSTLRPIAIPNLGMTRLYDRRVFKLRVVR